MFLNCTKIHFSKFQRMKAIKFLAIFLLVTLVSISNNVFSQAYLDVITEKACKKKKKIPDTMKTDELHMKLGICMLDAANPYHKQLKAEYGIDLEKNDDSGEKLGKIVGMKMATKCPTALLKLAHRSEEDGNTEKTVRGVITKIESDPFVVFSVKDEQGKTVKFFWFTFIESSADLTSKYKDFIGKTVEITYSNQEFFDPKIEEYRAFSVIFKLELVK